MVSESVWRRMLLAGTGLVIGVAAILALGVIPPVRTDTYPGATPDRVIPVLWVIIVANALVAAGLLRTTLVTRRGGSASKVLLGAAGLVALAMGFVLYLVAADIYRGPHWTFIPGATWLLFACTGGDLAAGVLAFTAVAVRLRQPPSRHDIKSLRLAAALFLVFWLAIVGITLATSAMPGGGADPVWGLHLLMPFVAGAFVVWWRNRNTIADRITGGMLAGLLFSVIDFAIEIMAQALPQLGKPQPFSHLTMRWMTWSEFWGDALFLGLAYAVMGIVLGMVGGLNSPLLAAALRGVRGGGGPAAPPGVS